MKNNFIKVEDAINWLENQRRFDSKDDLTKLKNAYKLLNLDFSKTKKIHVGGTNGKGSTTAFISNVLVNNNLKVGIFTSPYLIKFNERIKINNQNINDNDLLKYINFIYDFNEINNLRLTFFELLTLMTFKYFNDLNLDVIIMEIGIGGRLDSTNIINYDVTVITSIGLDHVNILGNTLELIATEKVGAVKEGGHLITYDNKKLNSILKNRVKDVSATIKLIDKLDINELSNSSSFSYNGNVFNLKLKGVHQRENAVLAYEVIKYLYGLDDERVIKFLDEANWDGRFEEIRKNVFIDGAHNIPAIKALINTVNKEFKDKEIEVIYSALGDKDINGMINLLEDSKYNITLTSFPDFRYKSLKTFETNKIKYIENSIDLINNLIKNKNEDTIVIITGSLHFIGFIKSNIKLIEGENIDENDISY